MRPFRSPFNAGTVTTPFTRVAGLAKQARLAYKPSIRRRSPRTSSRPKSMCMRQRTTTKSITRTSKPSSSRRRRGSPDEKFARAIKPSRFVEIPAEYRNFLGGTFQGKSMMTVFPLSAWNEDNELHIVYSEPISAILSTGEVDLCRDCTGKIALKRLR
jgi:hypothetical protein